MRFGEQVEHDEIGNGSLFVGFALQVPNLVVEYLNPVLRPTGASSSNS